MTGTNRGQSEEWSVAASLARAPFPRVVASPSPILFLILVVSFLPVWRQRLSSAEASSPVCISAAVAVTIAAVCRGVRPNLLQDPSHQSRLHLFAPPPAPAPLARAICFLDVSCCC